MIAKKYRLSEREMRKVLSKGKPFFSYMFVANTLPNKENAKRCGILLSAKVTPGSVNRNFWRRLFYDTISAYSDTSPFLDVVFIPRKGTLLDRKDAAKVEEFRKNIIFLSGKIQESSLTPKQSNGQI